MQTNEVNYDYSYQQKFESNMKKTIENISSITLSLTNIPPKHSTSQAVVASKTLQIRKHRRSQTSSCKCFTKTACRDGEPSRLGTVEQTGERNIRGMQGLLSYLLFFKISFFFKFDCYANNTIPECLEVNQLASFVRTISYFFMNEFAVQRFQ